MNTNAKLAVIAGLLAIVSVWTYSDSISRGDRFARGQKLLPNLNPDEVALIAIIDGEDTVTLERQEEEFTIAEMHGYPARNDAINRFFRDLLDIGLAKEIGAGSALAEELEIDPSTESTTEIALTNAAGQEMVRLRLGKSFEDGAGRYVQRLDQESSSIYLTEGSVYLSTKVDSFLRKEILDVSQSRVRRVQGIDFLIASEEEDGELALTAIPGGQKEKTFETNKLKSILSRLSFDTVLLADDQAVRDLPFPPTLTVDIDDETGYTLSFAEQEEQRYMRIQGHHNIGRVEIALDEPKEELKVKADKLTRATEIEEFTEFHASWVYEISSFTADKLKLGKADLIEDES